MLSFRSVLSRFVPFEGRLGEAALQAAQVLGVSRLSRSACAPHQPRNRGPHATDDRCTCRVRSHIKCISSTGVATQNTHPCLGSRRISLYCTVEGMLRTAAVRTRPPFLPRMGEKRVSPSSPVEPTESVRVVLVTVYTRLELRPCNRFTPLPRACSTGCDTRHPRPTGAYNTC